MAQLYGPPSDGSVIPHELEDAIAADASTPSSPIGGAIDVSVGTTRPTEGQSLQKSANGTSKTVVLTGHSQLYGQDESATGTVAATNGATQKRSTTPPTEVFAAAAATSSVGPVSVVNQAYPGDRTSDAISRWAEGQSGDVELFWLDTNDAKNYAGRTGGTLTDAQTLANLRSLIQRAHDRGAEVVVVGGAPVSTTTDAYRIFASAATERAIAERHGAKFVDVGELLRALPQDRGYWTDGVHGTTLYYSLVGSRLTALLGPKGVNPPKVAPGNRIRPTDALHVGGTTPSRSGATTGRTVSVAAGQSFTLPVDVTAPTLPVIRFYRGGTDAAPLGAGTIRISAHGGDVGIPDQVVKLVPGATGNGSPSLSYVSFPVLSSPGPDLITFTCEEGAVEVDMVMFAQPQGVSNFTKEAPGLAMPKHKAITLYPVGGVAPRMDASWAHMFDHTAGQSLLSDDGTTTVGVHWTFDLTLGESYSGVLLGSGASAAYAYGVHQGYMLIRNGTSLILRSWAGSSGMVNVTVADVFPATGRWRGTWDIVFNTTTEALDVYVDGALAGSSEVVPYRYLTPGLLAGTASGGGWASGSGTVYRP